MMADKKNQASVDNIIHVLQRIAPSFALDENGDATLSSHGFDSLAKVALLVALEDEFEFEFPDELVHPETFRTFSGLIAAVADIIAHQSQSD